MVLTNQLKSFGSVSLNDKKFFNEVFNELYVPLVMFAKSFLDHNQESAEDIVQDVFAKLLLKKTKFQSKISLKSYLYLSVKNSILNLQKHNKVKQLYFEEKLAGHSLKYAPFFDKILEAEAKYQLLKALDMLPDRCKKVFELSLKGLKNNEIAEEMKISIETVKSHKKKGKVLLKNILKPCLFGFIYIILNN